MRRFQAIVPELNQQAPVLAYRRINAISIGRVDAVGKQEIFEALHQ